MAFGGPAPGPADLQLSDTPPTEYHPDVLAAVYASATAESAVSVKRVCIEFGHAVSSYWAKVLHVYITAKGKWMEVYRDPAAKQYICSWCETSWAACHKRKVGLHWKPCGSRRLLCTSACQARAGNVTVLRAPNHPRLSSQARCGDDGEADAAKVSLPILCVWASSQPATTQH